MDLSGFTLLTLARQYGPLIAFMALVLWQNWRRETKLGGRIESLEKSLTDTLMPLVEKTSGVIARNTVVMQRLEKLLFPRSPTKKSAAASRHSPRPRRVTASRRSK